MIDLDNVQLPIRDERDERLPLRRWHF
jgi:hypothetical protein